MKELEKELGITLFYRSGRGVTLTNDGTEFLLYAKQIYGQYETILEKYGKAGACAVMALERLPADIRAADGVSRMSDPKMIKGIQEAVSIPVMAKCRIGTFSAGRKKFDFLKKNPCNG